jgi:Ctr copper transporter family
MKRAMTLSSTAARKFGGGDADDEEQQQHQQQQSPSIGCGFSADDDYHADKASSSSFSSSRRRLQHVQSAGECNNVTNFFCWMQCLEVPNHEQARGYLNEGYSLYCLDPATLASSGNRVSSAAAPCEYGYVHNAACQGSWQPTAPGVNAYPLNVEDQDEDGQQELAFCYGGTSMYMNPTCVIYLFPKWVLSTPGKLAAAAIGTLFSGMALEKIIQQRRFVVASMDPGYKRLGVSSLFYAVQLTLGYLIMLVVMTYSGPLFLSVVLGLVGGHVLFNASDAFFPGKKRESSDKMNDDDSGDGEGCCRDGPAADTDKTTNCSKMENNCSTGSCCKKETSCGTKSPDVHVPEGITPCCLNTL